MDWDKFNRVWDENELSAAEKLVMIRLLDHENGDGIAYPSQGHIAQKTSLSLATVHRSLKRLKDLGKVETRERGKRLEYVIYPDVRQGDVRQGDVRQGDVDKKNLRHSDVGTYVTVTHPIETPNETPNKLQTPKQTPSEPSAPVSTSYQGWHQLLKDAEDRSKRIGVLVLAYQALFPDLGPACGGRIGNLAKRWNSFSKVLRYFWDLSSKQVDCLDCDGLIDYIQKIESNERSRRAGGYGDQDPDPGEEADHHFQGFKRV